MCVYIESNRGRFGKSSRLEHRFEDEARRNETRCATSGLSGVDHTAVERGIL